MQLTKLKTAKHQKSFEYLDDKNNIQFPLEIFPETMQYIINRLHDSSDFETQITSSAILFVVSTIIGNSREIEVKSTWIDTPNLWLAIVGRRGTMKTPTVNYLLKPLKDDEKEYARRFSEDMMNYLKIDKKQREEFDKPIRRQRYSNDTTVEGLIKAMNENHNGIGIYKDELNGFFDEMNRYTSGGNLEFYLSAFNGGQYIKNRMTYDAITINDIYLSMLGSIQPEKLKAIADEYTDNGMVDRWLYVMSDNIVPNTTDDDIPGEVSTEYRNFIANIVNSCDKYQMMQWLPGAKKHFYLVLNEFEDMMKSDTIDDKLFTYLSKIKTYLARFTTIITMMDYSNMIGIDHINKAKSLALYFIQTAKSTFIGFENQKHIDIIFNDENARTKKDKVIALTKHLPNLTPTIVCKLVGCSRQFVYNIKNEKV